MVNNLHNLLEKEAYRALVFIVQCVLYSDTQQSIHEFAALIQSITNTENDNPRGPDYELFGVCVPVTEGGGAKRGYKNPTAV